MDGLRDCVGGDRQMEKAESNFCISLTIFTVIFVAVIAFLFIVTLLTAKALHESNSGEVIYRLRYEMKVYSGEKNEKKA